MGERVLSDQPSSARAVSVRPAEGEDNRPPPLRPKLIVGIGASAGGVEAFQKFFSQLPPESGLAFVVIQHLDPHHASILVDLLARFTPKRVLEARGGAPVEADHVYVLRPGQVLRMQSGVFLSSAEPCYHPIDVFFRSLAEDQGAGAAGIILSGSGADGTAGMRAIKEHGGITLAQRPETAAHDAMPKSAILAGVVDNVLKVEWMPEKLVELASSRPEAAADFDQGIAASVDRICAVLQRATGHDFSRYKKSTLLRRIRLRLERLHLASADEYLEALAKDPEEAGRLLNEILIGVTHFFRDPAEFEYLAQHVLPRITAAKREQEAVRVWVPGCASGEEAYSLAILFCELAAAGPKLPVLIFASDIDQEALHEARKGRYPTEIAAHVSPERLERFFVREEEHYRVVPKLRDMCIFSSHSVVRDPPFSGLDLVSCRNLLIYLEVDLQEKVIQRLHYALKPGAYLFLGPSEIPRGLPELFATVDKHHHVYQCLEVPRPAGVFPLTAAADRRAPPPRAAEARPAVEQLESQLRTTQANLAAAVSELAAANEEFMTANEELCSTNQELSTSQEELKAVNEELEALNTELRQNLEADRRLATMVRDSNDAITVQDLDGRILAWNRGAANMYGYSEEEAVGLNIEVLVPEEARDEAHRTLDAAIREEEIRSLEVKRRTKDGRVLDVWLTTTKLVDDRGRTVAVATTERDVTERKRAEAESRLLAAVVKDSNDAITVQDLEGRILAWNRGAANMYGYSEDEALRLNSDVLVPDGARGDARRILEAARRGEEIVSLDVKRQTKDGRVLDVWLTTTKLVDDRGRPVAVATTERDITGRKR
jgi:two-component system CheB/CheR fusion protein